MSDQDYWHSSLKSSRVIVKTPIRWFKRSNKSSSKDTHRRRHMSSRYFALPNLQPSSELDWKCSEQVPLGLYHTAQFYRLSHTPNAKTRASATTLVYVHTVRIIAVVDSIIQRTHATLWIYNSSERLEHQSVSTARLWRFAHTFTYQTMILTIDQREYQRIYRL